MKSFFKVICAIVGIFIILTIVFVFVVSDNSIRDAFNRKGLKPNDLNTIEPSKVKIKKINFNQIDSILNTTKGYKHLYLFSYYCSPCRESIKNNKYKYSEVGDSIISIENTFLISCDSYGVIDKLEKLMHSSKIKEMYILDNDSYISSKFNNFERLKIFLSRHYSGFYDENFYAYPYNLVFDSTNRVISSYPGGMK